MRNFCLIISLTAFYLLGQFELIDGESVKCGEKTCIHGRCESNVCACDSCFKGLSCELFENAPPKFDRNTYQVTPMQSQMRKDTVLTQVRAEDPDRCQDSGKCDCATVRYSLVAADGSPLEDDFKVDPVSGTISASRDLDLAALDSSGSGVITISLKASNPGNDLEFDSASLVISLVSAAASGADQPLQRYRRAVPVVPTKMDFSLTQTNNPTNSTNIQMGQRLTFELAVTFPSSANSLTVEIFGSETTNKVAMSLCHIKDPIIGSDLTGGTISAPLMEGRSGTVWPYTRVVYNLSNYQHSQSSVSDISTIQIKFQFEAVVLYEPEILMGTTYYVSAGSEYLNGQEIWVGQSGYQASNITVVEPTPTITFVGDNNIYPNRVAVYDLTIVAKQLYIGLDLEIFTPLNESTVMSLCIANRYYQGDGYSCLPTTIGQPQMTSTVRNGKILYTKATATVGFVTNRLFAEGITDDAKLTIKLKIVFQVNKAAIIGNYYYLGAAMSHVTNKIWTGKEPFQVLAKTPLAPPASPIVHTIDFLNGNNNAKIGTVSSILLTITVPDASQIDYTINGISIDKKSEICGTRLYRVGSNIPCMEQMDPVITSTLEADGSTSQRSITYEGVRHVKMGNNATDDQLLLEFLFRPINSSINTVGDKVNIGVTLSWSGGTGPQVTKEFTLQSFDVISDIPSERLPTFEMALQADDGNISVDDSLIMTLKIQLKPAVIYSPVNIEFFLPANGTSARMSFCDARIVSVGKRILCFNQKIMSTKFELISRSSEPNVPDKVLLPVGSLCTGGTLGSLPSSDDEIKFALGFKVLPHTLNVLNNKAFINAGMIVSSTQIWVGNVPLTFIAKPPPDTLTGADLPLIFSNRLDDPASSNVFQNDIVVLQYTVKIPPNKRTALSLRVYNTDITADGDFSVCYMRFVKKGNSIPCITSTITSVNYTSAFFTVKKESTMNFGIVINAGMTPLYNSMGFDDNSILVEVAVRFGTIPATTTKILATLTYTAATINKDVTLNINTASTRFNGTVTGTEPTFGIFLYSLFQDVAQANVSSVAPGEALRAVMTTQILPNSLQSLKMIFSSKPGTMHQMDILSVSVLRAGANVICITPGLKYQLTKESRSSSSTRDMLTLDLGTVCHRQIINIANTTDDDNKLYVEAVFVVLKTINPMPADLDLNAIGMLNNDQVYVTKIIVKLASSNANIVDFKNSTQDHLISAVASPTTVEVGKVFIVNVTVTVAPLTQVASALIKVAPMAGNDGSRVAQAVTNADMSTSSLFSFSSGLHIGLNSAIDKLPPAKSTSSTNSSQIDNIIIDLGVIQNVGTQYRSQQMNYSGINPLDQIVLSIPLRLSDNMLNIQAAVIDLNISAMLGPNEVSVIVPITVTRTGVTAITIETVTTLVSTNNVYAENNDIEVSLFAKLSNSSQLECRQFLIVVATPSFITFKALKNSSYTSPGYAIEQSTLITHAIQFKVPYFFFSEALFVQFTMAMTPSTTLTRERGQSKLTLPIIYTCRKASENVWINKLDDIQTTVKGQDIVIAGCNSDLKLDDTNIIKDCAIRAFMSPETGFEAIKVRPNSNTIWKTHTRGGVHFEKLRYIDVVFGMLRTVNKITLTSSLTNKPSEVAIYGTMDGRSFSFYRIITIAFSGDDSVISLSKPQFTYRGIRVAVTRSTEPDKPTGFRMLLVGCTPSGVTDTNTFDPCVTKPYDGVPDTPVPEYYSRGVLSQSSHLFVCDQMPSSILVRPNDTSLAAESGIYLDTYHRCFRTTSSNPTVWLDMGPHVGKVIGYNSDTKTIYGLGSRDLNAYVMSRDDGVTWTGLNKAGWLMEKELASPALETPIVLPWVSTSGGFSRSEIGTSCTIFAALPWNFCYDGIYTNSNRYLTWNDCCQGVL